MLTEREIRIRRKTQGNKLDNQALTQENKLDNQALTQENKLDNQILTQENESDNQALTQENESDNQTLTTGGRGDYYLDSQDFNKLANLLSQASAHQLKPLLKSLLTNRELVDITRRIIVGKMLLEGFTYQEIQKRTKNAARTTSFVKQSMLTNGGILKKLIEQTYNLAPIDRYIKRRLKKGK